MIISHKYRYIFLHCRKTAGSSISVSLARDLGPEDLQLSGLTETLAEGIKLTDRLCHLATLEGRKSGRLGQKLALMSLRSKDARDRAHKNLALTYFRSILQEAQPQHAYADNIARAFSEEWASYRKFCVVRNPWTKTVSDYFWRIRDRANPPSFAEFVSAIERKDPLGDIVPIRYHDNWPLYTINDQIITDDTIRFEDLLPSLTKTLAKFDIPFDGWLPRAKGNHRPKTGKNADPFSFYTPELRDTVGRLYEKEIDAFGYRFERELTIA